MDTRLKKIELLAPAGRWEVLDVVLERGADAVYLAGKEYNMRRHRSDFNFSRDEIARAADKVHAAGAKIYITVNSLLSERELDEIGEYLAFLESVAVDALIVQDLGLIQLITRSGFNLPLHASTMMNIHSAEGARACADSGISRIICSRDVALHQVKQMRDDSGLEMEYFVHGDMCIAQSGQCYMSGILFGRSSNRGKCMKPCRWPYQMVNQGGGVLETKMDGSYLLATKDICLLEFIPELIEAGVHALKIEGRMRAPAFLAGVVEVYRRTIDQYCSDPYGFINDIRAYDELYRNRVRDFSACCALRKPDAGLVGSSGEREPFFLSTAVREKEIDLLHPEEVFNDTGDVQTRRTDQVNRVLLAVHAGSPEGAREALERGAEWIYIGGEVFRLEDKDGGCLP